MHHSYNQSQQHLFVIARIANLAYDHELLHPLRQIDIKQTYTEKRSEHRPEHRSGHTQCNHQIHHTPHGSRHLMLQKDSQCNQNKTIARISHTKCEEKSEKRSHHRSRVKLCVIGHTIHFRQHFIHAHHRVVLQLYRHIVAFTCGPYFIINILRGKESPHFVFLVCRDPTLQHHQTILCRLLRTQHYAVESHRRTQPAFKIT